MSTASDLLIRSLMRRVFASRADELAAYEQPAGDPGLFGPASITWRVHADFPGMMAGGLCALMLQTLHPRALAGVWDHSSFRTDLLGRLRRTTVFVAASTYGSRAFADAEIARVRRIHERVIGQLPDGRRYAANEPELLTWVHVTEAWSFVQGFLRYARISLTPADLDRYYDEVRRVAEALGARDVPRSLAQVDAYFEHMQTELEYSERSATVMSVLEHARLPGLLTRPVRPLFIGSGAALLPEWALQWMDRSLLRRRADAAAAKALYLAAPTVRSALRNGVAAHACRRVGLAYEALRQRPD